MPAPYFTFKQKTKAEMVICDDCPSSVMTFKAWKILRAFLFEVRSPSFYEVDKNMMRHLEEAFKDMTNHAAQSTNSQRAVGGGVRVDAEWEEGNNLAMVRVFPKSNKYVIFLKRDESNNVTIDFPAMTLSDIPSMNQARKICGQVVQIATSMERSG